MSTTGMPFGSKSFKPKPPDKGSFPLDHDNECKRPMLRYMICLRQNNNSISVCHDAAQEYLDCRMKHDLMAKEDWSKLGFKEKSNTD